MKYLIILVLSMTMLTACKDRSNTSSTEEALKVNNQQKQYSIGQPVPAFDWSLERHLLIELYNLRNRKVSTHAVWRSDYGMVEGDCPSMGYGLPYDTSLTNPLVATDISQRGNNHTREGGALVSIEQPEPNGVFASKNTSATWVMCLGESGAIEPVYIESKVTIYPGAVLVDYDNNRVVRSGAATVMIRQNGS